MAGLAAAGLAGAAHAQTAATPPLAITVSGEVRHDSNVSRSNSERASLRGLTRSDEHFDPTVQIVVNKALGRNLLMLDTAVGYDFYRRNTVLNRERIALNGDLQLNLSRCRLDLLPTFSRRQSDLGEVAILSETGTRSVRNVETAQSYAAQAECGGDIGLRPIAGYRRDISTNSNDRRALQDNHRNHYTLGLGYARPTLGKLSLLGGIDDVAYPRRPRIGNQDDGYVSRQVGLSFERDLGRALRGSVQVNYLDLNPRRSDVPGFSGLTYTVALTATFADRLQVVASLSREAQPSLQADAVYRIQRTHDLTATYAFSDRLSFEAGATFGKRDYAGQGLLLGPQIGDDRRNVYSASASYKPNRRLRFSLGGRYETRDADGTFYDYNNLSESLSASFLF